MEFYRGVVSPILDHLDSEAMHVAARESLHLAEIIPGGLTALEWFNDQHKQHLDPRQIVVLGSNVDVSKRIVLPNRFVVGAGWDKVGVTARAWGVLSAGGIEVGAVLPNPQEGNPKTRQWYRRGVGLNRLGFNSPGRKVVAKNLGKYVTTNTSKETKIGANLGINKDTPPADAPAAYALVAEDLYEYYDWATINVSSPNTKDLRLLQDAIYLRDINQAVVDSMMRKGGMKPLYDKIAPDLSSTGVTGVIKAVKDNGLSGMVVANTTVREDLKAKYGFAGEMGGLSGDDPEFSKMTTELIAYVRREVGQDPHFEIQGVGAINSFESAKKKFLAGANNVQIVTGIRQVGPTLFGRLSRDCSQWLDDMRISTPDQFNQLIGSDAKKYK